MGEEHVFSTLAQIASVSGRLEKEKLAMKLAKDDGDLLKEIILFTYNPNWTYRMSAPTEFAAGFPHVPASLAWPRFRRVLKALLERSAPLAELKEKMQDVLSTSDKATRPWLCSILDRELKIGFKQWSKVFPRILPKQKLMLCDTWDMSKLPGKRYCEPKLDGLRMLVVVDSHGECVPISRGGKPMWNMEHIFKEIKAAGAKNVLLDGEAFAGTFGDSISICKSESPHPLAKTLKFYMFDMLPLGSYESDTCSCPQSLAQRKASLHVKFFAGKKPKYLVELPYPLVSKVSEVERLIENYLADSFEGCVLKDPNSLYVFDRSDAWLKYKPQETADLTVYDAKPGKPGTKYSKSLGALLCKGEVNFRGNKFKVKVAVGGGFSVAWRTHFWQLHKKDLLDGTVIEVKYQDCTEANLCEASRVPGAKYSLRFPRFKRLRDDK